MLAIISFSWDAARGEYVVDADPPQLVDLATFLRDNAEDAETCEGVKRTMVGGAYRCGGGAAPLTEIWRLPAPGETVSRWK